MANGTAFHFQRRVLVDKRPQLVRVALHAGGICSERKACLLQLESSMRIMAVAALHHAFQDFVVKRHVELRLLLRVALETELRLARLEHFSYRRIRFFLSRRKAREGDGFGPGREWAGIVR